MNEQWSKGLEETKGTPIAKERLRLVLEVMGGDLEVEEACSRLKIRADEFHEMRDCVLQVMVDQLEKAQPATAHDLENDLQN